MNNAMIHEGLHALIPDTALVTCVMPRSVARVPLTDLQRFQELYAHVGITPKLTTVDNYPLQAGCVPRRGQAQVLEVANDGSQPATLVGGYNGFSTTIVFDMDGKFLYQAFWE